MIYYKCRKHYTLNNVAHRNNKLFSSSIPNNWILIRIEIKLINESMNYDKF